MVDISVEDGKLVCTFKGRLDTVNCAKWEKELLDKVGSEKIPVIFDLGNVEYVASGFLRVCLQISKLAGAENLKLINVNEYVRKVYSLSGFDKYLSIES
jgi:anti-anti-sigma factor